MEKVGSIDGVDIYADEVAYKEYIVSNETIKKVRELFASDVLWKALQPYMYMGEDMSDEIALHTFRYKER